MKKKDHQIKDKYKQILLNLFDVIYIEIMNIDNLNKLFSCLKYI